MRELLFYDNGGSSIGKGKDGGNGGNAGNKGKGKPGLVGYGVDLASRLMSGDFHGAIMKVVRSRCPSRVGIEGIMVKETKMCFELVTKRNQVKGRLYADSNSHSTEIDG